MSNFTAKRTRQPTSTVLRNGTLPEPSVRVSSAHSDGCGSQHKERRTRSFMGHAALRKTWQRRGWSRREGEVRMHSVAVELVVMARGSARAHSTARAARVSVVSTPCWCHVGRPTPRAVDCRGVHHGGHLPPPPPPLGGSSLGRHAAAAAAESAAMAALPVSGRATWGRHESAPRMNGRGERGSERGEGRGTEPSTEHAVLGVRRVRRVRWGPPPRALRAAPPSRAVGSRQRLVKGAVGSRRLEELVAELMQDVARGEARVERVGRRLG